MITIDSNTSSPDNQSSVRRVVESALQADVTGWELATLEATWAAVFELEAIGTPEILAAEGRIDEVTEQRASQMATNSILNNQAKLSSLTSPLACIINVEPIPDTKRCVAAVYACDLAELSESYAIEKLAAVKQFANSISGAANAEQSAEQSAAELQVPTWAALSKLFFEKLRAEFEAQRKQIRTYVTAIAAIAAICFVPIPFRLSCPTRCEPTSSRFVAAPFAARLERTHSVIGQEVKTGDLLATLDGGEIISELAGLNDKANQAKQRQMAALSTGDHATAEHERLELEQLSREIELLDRRKKQLEIRSPIDGIVVDGDLERAQGTPLEIGQSLFEIASLDELVAEIAVPECDVRFVNRDLPVSVSLESSGTSAIRSSVDRVHLRSEIRDSEAVFIAEAAIPNTDRNIRPGMNANTIIHVGYRPLAWVFLHRPYSSLRQWIGW